MNDEKIEIIHQYLNGRMTDAEREIFEQEMAADKDLREAVALEKTMLLALEDAGDRQLKETIQSVQQKLEGEGFFAAQPGTGQTPFTARTNPFITNRRLAVAAAVLFILGAVWYKFTRNPSPDTLFAKYYQVDHRQVNENIEALRSFGLVPVKTDQDTLRDALVLFDQGQYLPAIELLKALLAKHPENEMARYYQGLAYLGTNAYDKALESLRPLASSTNFPLQKDAKWNLGLCYLKVPNGLPPAQNIFKELAADNNFSKRAEAENLYNRLK